MKVYVVMIDWSTEDEYGHEFEVYSTFSSALKRFNQSIKNECDPENSWVGVEVFDEDGNVNDGYELFCNCDKEITEEQELYWEASHAGWLSKYTNISLKIKEVLE